MASALDLTEIDKLKVADLKKELKSRGLSTIGNKLDLVDRLQESLQPAALEVGDVIDDDVNEDEALGEDELLAEDQKSPDLLICEDAILSPEKKEAAKVHIVLSRLPTVEKENGGHVPKLATKPLAVTTTTAISVLPKAAVVAANVSSNPAKAPAESQDKLVSRAKRFNMPLTEDARKNARAERFGGGNIKTPTTTAPISAKLQQRTKRFGSDQEILPKGAEGDRLLKRKARFGAVVAGSKLSDDTEE